MKSARMMMIGVALTMAGCGSSSGGSSGGSGGGGGAGFTAPSGTLGGAAFSATGAMALSFAPAVCPASGGGTDGITQVAVLFTNVPSLCSVYLAAGQCNDKANLVAVNASVSHVKPGGATTALTPGTYPLTVATPTADAGGNYTITAISYTKNSATCVDAAASVTSTAGSVTISDISATRVTGSLTATFSDGSSYSGPFDVALCADTTPTCTQAAGCTGTAACIP